MGIFKSGKIRTYLLAGIVVLLAAMAAASFVTRQQCKAYERQIRGTIAGLLGTVLEEYPDVREEELIALLNEEQEKKGGEELLAQYGVTEEVAAAAFMENRERKILSSVLLGVGISGILLLVIFFLFLRGRERRVRQLTEYIGHILRQEYDLAPDENSEDELSHLKNELYKVTVMLREASRRDQKQREAVLEAVSDISHQLKTPMTSVQILLDNLLEDREMEEAVRIRFLEEVSRQTGSMGWLIGELLKLSRLDADVVEFEHRQIVVADMLEEICGNLAVLAEIKETTLCIQGNRETCIWGDYRWNSEALTNILKNAIEHSRRGTAVTVTIEENAVYTAISVTDCGEGILEKDRKHIFERFYRSEGAADDSIGIGLAMAKAVIEKQGGYIMVDSREGEGTTFTIKYMKLFSSQSPESHNP